MMYPFMTLDDNTEIVHSEMQPDHRVKVYIEKPDAEGSFPFCSVLLCRTIPGRRWPAAPPRLRSISLRCSQRAKSLEVLLSTNPIRPVFCGTVMAIPIEAPKR